MKIYVIKDSIVGKYMNPFVMHNDEEAKRAFAQAVNSGRDTTVVTNYRDMQLFGLGEYNEDTGVIISNVYHIINGVDVKKQPEPFATFDINKPVAEEGEVCINQN